MRSVIILCLIFISSMLASQDDTISVINQIDLENIVENQELEDDLDVTNAFDELVAMHKNKLNLNEANYDQINRLQLLQDFQITTLIQYRQEYGKLLSVYELQAVPGWNILTIKRVLPYITIKQNAINLSRLRDLAKEGDHIMFLRWKRVLNQRAGFDPERAPTYLGDPNHVFARYRYNYNNQMRWGITAEKDPGEEFFHGNNRYGFDFYSAFLHYRNENGVLQSLTLGDYTVSMGQGLIRHNNFGSGKSAQVINIVKGGATIRPYSSVNEALFMRGIASSIKINDRLSATGFYSRRNSNGNAIQDTTIDTGFETFTSIIINGYHRTSNEIEKKGTICQENIGGILQYRAGGLKISGNYLSTKFDRVFDTRDGLYRKFAFEGRALRNYSMDFTYRWKNLNIFGEWAKSGNAGNARAIGIQSVLHPKIDIAALYRNYDANYQVFNANAFAESSSPVNEAGMYLAIIYRIHRDWQISVYHDVWKSPWLRFRVDAPSNGYESFVRLDYKKKKKYHLYLQYKYEDKAENLDYDQPIRSVKNRQLHRLRIHFNNTLTPGLSLRNRVEYAHQIHDVEKSSGWLIYQDIIYRPTGKPYSFTSRFALFDTDDFASRIYAYENDILYEFRIPFYQDRGTRFYINTRYKLSSNFTFELRYENTHYYDRTSIGSGGEEILGQSRSEIKTQLKIQF